MYRNKDSKKYGQVSQPALKNMNTKYGVKVIIFAAQYPFQVPS